MRRGLAWAFAGALVVLSARSLAYALEPGPLAKTLRHEAGGPRLPAVALVALALGLGLSAAIVWLVALGVRERALMERRTAPRLRLGRTIARASCLSVATIAAFGLLESYLHWRAGLGWHALHCLIGPVHSDALPILVSLSIAAAASFGAAEHVLDWIRRTVARILGGQPKLSAREPLTLVALDPLLVAGAASVGSCGARAPPLSLV